MDIIECPACDTQQDECECFLGHRLGWLTHYRCRYCGITFSESPLSRDIAALSEECVTDCEACAGDAHSQLASYYTPDQGGQG